MTAPDPIPALALTRPPTRTHSHTHTHTHTPTPTPTPTPRPVRFKLGVVALLRGSNDTEELLQRDVLWVWCRESRLWSSDNTVSDRTV